MSARSAHAGPLLLIGFVAVACQGTTRPSPTASTDLQRALRFSELDTGGVTREISTEKDGVPDEVRFPRSVPIDLNSHLQIGVEPGAVTRGKLSESEVASLEELEARQGAFEALLTDLAELVDRRTAALAAYEEYMAAAVGGSEPLREQTFQSFDASRSGAAAAEEALMTAASDLFLAPWMGRSLSAEEQTEFEVLEEAVDVAFGELDGAQIEELLRPELAALAEERERVIGGVLEGRLFELRLEAFLRSPGKELIAVHLPGYDSLEEGKLERRDRWGLAMEGAAKERFGRLSRQSVEIAEAGERVRRGEQDLDEALQGLRGTVVGEAADLIVEGQRLVEQLDGDALEQRAARTRAALESFASTSREGLEAALVLAIEDGDRGLQQAVTSLESDLRGVAGLEDLISALEALERLRQERRSEDLMQLPMLLGELRTAAGDLGPALEQVVEAGAPSFEATFRSALQGLSTEAEEAVRGAWQNSGLEAELRAWSELVDEVAAFRRDLGALTDAPGYGPLATDVKVPGAFDVPLDDAPATFLDLERTPRLRGDQLTVRATLLRDKKEVGAADASFDVEQFGWHARLDPGVILARPTRLKDRDETFGFAPLLSWMHTFRPRPEEDGSTASFFRATGMSFGPHATFLNFDPDKEIEIGLGLTIGLWDGILVFGGGWNIHGDGADDGAIYGFVGSSLIPLLQAMQSD